MQTMGNSGSKLQKYNRSKFKLRTCIDLIKILKVEDLFVPPHENCEE